jgi:hypothetical protein
MILYNLENLVINSDLELGCCPAFEVEILNRPCESAQIK